MRDLCATALLKGEFLAQGAAMKRDHENWAVAHLLVARYGVGALDEAKARTNEAMDRGDNEAAAIWRDVESALVEDGDGLVEQAASAERLFTE
jgi:hypothetical protein